MNALQALAAGTESFSHGMHWKGDNTCSVVEYIGKGAFPSVSPIARLVSGRQSAALDNISWSAGSEDGTIPSSMYVKVLSMLRVRYQLTAVLAGCTATQPPETYIRENPHLGSL